MGDTERKDEDTEQTGPKRGRFRSPNYPAFGLATAVQKAEKIYQIEHSSSVPADVAVKHMGYGTLSGPGGRALAALKTYGIMAEQSGNYRFTAEGLSVVMHADDEQDVLARMVNRPEVFQQILAKYPDRLPSDQTLKVILVRDLGFSDTAADSVIVAIRETMELAKSPTGAYSQTMQSTVSPQISNPKPGAHEPAVANRQDWRDLAQASPDQTVQVWSLGKGVTVELRSNAPLTAAHFGLLKKYVELAEEAERQTQAVTSGEAAT